jgi:hypothetical protein
MRHSKSVDRSQNFCNFNLRLKLELYMLLMRWSKIGSPSWTRTNDISINSRMLYQLSYQGIGRSIA